MVNKDQLEQSPEGKQVLALLADNFPDDEFQPALTLIEQRYTEDQPVWDADLNRDGQWPFQRTTDAHRLLIFFASPSHLAAIQTELAQRADAVATQAADTAARAAPAAAKPKAKQKKLSPRRSPARPAVAKLKAKKKTKPPARQARKSPPAKMRVKRKPVKAAKPRVKSKAKGKRKK